MTTYETLLELIRIPTDDCIIWPLGCTSSGYPAFHVGHSTRSAHRAACEWTHGSPPLKGMQAAHTCGAKRCVNPRHLRWATQSENEADKQQHGRTNRGSRHGHARLSEDDVLFIRLLLAIPDKASLTDIARRFDVDATAVHKIKTGLTWGWLQ